MLKSIYYNPSKLLSQNKLMNFVIGERGNGKTFGFKNWSINDFLKNGNQFIYLRRYKTEFKRINSYFDDIKFKYPNHTFKVHGGTFIIDDKIAGYYLPLSTYGNVKSTAFPKVNKVIYDEFLIDKKSMARYLTNEVNALLSMVETIGRMRDNIRIFFLANTISIVNPYFIEWNIIPDLGTRFTKKNDIIIETTNCESYREEKKKTRFGKFIANTTYGKYAIENDFLNDNENFIMKRTPNSKLQFILNVDNRYYGVWFDNKEMIGFVSTKKDMSNPLHFTFDKNDFDGKNIYIKSYRDNVLIETMVNFFKDGRLMFDTQAIKSDVFSMLSKINIF